MGRLVAGPTELTVGLALDKHVRLLSVNRRGLVYDTRFGMPFRMAPRAAVFIYNVLEGRFRWHGGPTFDGPSLFVANEADFEGADGRHYRTLRATGEPFCAVELRIALSDWNGPMPQEPTPIKATDAVFSAARAYLHAGHARRGQREVTSLAEEYLAALAAEGIVPGHLQNTLTHDEGWRGQVWEILRPTIERLALGTTQDELAASSGFAARRLERAFAKFADTVDLSWAGYREGARRYRIRVAAMLLSNPALTVVQVARAAGYSSAEAFAHALRAEGLPSAGELRAFLASDTAPQINRR